MGIPVPGYRLTSQPTTFNFPEAIKSAVDENTTGLFNRDVRSALLAAVPILNRIATSEKIPNINNYYSSTAPLNSQPGMELLVTK